MGIVLTVLDPPHQAHPNLITALPAGIGQIIDLDTRLVSPRYDALFLTANGLVVRDPGSGDFFGVPWANFSLADHLRIHNRHAVLTLWIEAHRPVELAIDRRLARNISAAAPILQRQPGVAIDQVVVNGNGFSSSGSIGSAYDTVLRPFVPNAGSEPSNLHALHNVAQQAYTKRRRRQMAFTVLAVGMLLAAAAVGSFTSAYVNGSVDARATDNLRLLTSEPIELD